MENSARVQAVLAALEKVREHVDEYSAEEELEPSAYNRWIGMLNGPIGPDSKALLLEDVPITAGEYLLHLDAAIAFLNELLAAST